MDCADDGCAIEIGVRDGDEEVDSHEMIDIRGDWLAFATKTRRDHT